MHIYDIDNKCMYTHPIMHKRMYSVHLNYKQLDLHFKFISKLADFMTVPIFHTRLYDPW